MIQAPHLALAQSACGRKLLESDWSRILLRRNLERVAIGITEKV
jgi:hypothetical protein